MDDKMPCGAPVGAFCICHITTITPMNDIMAGLPAAEPWQLSKRRGVVTDLSVSTDGPA
jgi:hypothetical protein